MRVLFLQVEEVAVNLVKGLGVLSTLAAVPHTYRLSFPACTQEWGVNDGDSAR